MLRYFYGLNPRKAATEPGVYFDLKLFTVAGKYVVVELFDEATKNVNDWLSANWRAPSFLLVVKDIYESTPAHGAELREAARDVCREHLADLMVKKGFKEILLGLPELQLDMLKLVADADRELDKAANKK